MNQIDDEKLDQLELGLKDPFFNNFYVLKSRLGFWRKYFISKGYIRSSWTWAFIILSLGLIAAQIYYVQRYYSDLPSSIPILQFYADAKYRIASTRLLRFAPSLSAAFLMVSIAISYNGFYKDKILSMFILFINLITTSFFTYIIFRIFALYHVR